MRGNGIEAVRACGAEMGTLRRPIMLADFVEIADRDAGNAIAGLGVACAATFATAGAAEIRLIGGEVEGWTDGLRIAGAKFGIVAIGDILWAGPNVCRPSGVAPILR